MSQLHLDDMYKSALESEHLRSTFSTRTFMRHFVSDKHVSGNVREETWGAPRLRRKKTLEDSSNVLYGILTVGPRCGPSARRRRRRRRRRRLRTTNTECTMTIFGQCYKVLNNKTNIRKKYKHK